jgi:hypothetical protein
MLVFTSGLLAAQTPKMAEPADPVSGLWSGDGNGAAKFDLAFDGKHTVTGKVGTPQGPADIRTGTFDPKSGALKLEGETKGPDGAPVKFLIVGQIKDKVATGTWQFGTAKGSYRMSRKPKAA